MLRWSIRSLPVEIVTIFNSEAPLPDRLKKAQRQFYTEIVTKQSTLPASIDWMVVLKAGITNMTPGQIKKAHTELVKRYPDHQVAPAYVISEAHRVAMIWGGRQSPYLTDP